jgi:hypothetical protein
MTSDFTSHILPPYQHQSFNQGYDIGTNPHSFPQSLSNNIQRPTTRDTQAAPAPKTKQEKKRDKPPRKKKMYSGETTTCDLPSLA